MIPSAVRHTSGGRNILQFLRGFGPFRDYIASLREPLFPPRAMEPEENTDPDHYSEAFRLTPETMADMPVVPTVPPLRPKKD